MKRCHVHGVVLRWGRVFAIAGVVAAGVYVAGDVVSGLLYPGYSFRDQWISELTARPPSGPGCWGS